MLQQLIYYQGFFSFCWFIANMTLVTYKRIPSASKIRGAHIIAFSLTMILPAVELLRLPVGFYANLKEDIASLVVFSLLTLAEMIVPAFLLSKMNPQSGPQDMALNTVLLAMLGLELIFSVFTVSRNMYIRVCSLLYVSQS